MAQSKPRSLNDFPDLATSREKLTKLQADLRHHQTALRDAIDNNSHLASWHTDPDVLATDAATLLDQGDLGKLLQRPPMVDLGPYERAVKLLESAIAIQQERAESKRESAVQAIHADHLDAASGPLFAAARELLAGLAAALAARAKIVAIETEFRKTGMRPPLLCSLGNQVHDAVRAALRPLLDHLPVGLKKEAASLLASADSMVPQNNGVHRCQN